MIIRFTSRRKSSSTINKLTLKTPIRQCARFKSCSMSASKILVTLTTSLERSFKIQPIYSALRKVPSQRCLLASKKNKLSVKETTPRCLDIHMQENLKVKRFKLGKNKAYTKDLK